MARLKIYNTATGQWEYVGGGSGSDEVFIQPDDPIASNPTAELWYDTDDTTAPLINALQPSEVFHSEITADVVVTASSAATANSIINPGNVSYDGATPIMLEFFSVGVRPGTTTNSQILLHLFDGNTDLGYWSQLMNPAAGQLISPVHLRRRLTPSAGLHNYNVRAWVSAGTGSQVGAGVGGAAATFQPGFLRAERVLQGAPGLAMPTTGLEANRPSPVGRAGLRYYATDTLRDWLCDGTGWIIMSEPVITTFVPVVTPSSGTITTLGAVKFVYHRRDGYLDWTVSIAIVTAGTGAGNITFTLPIASASVTSPATARAMGSGREDGATGKMLNVVSNGSAASMFFYDNTYPGVSGALLQAGGQYQMASRYT